MAQTKTYLDIVKECDNFPYPTGNQAIYNSYLKNYYAFKVAGYPQVLGHVPNYIVRAFTFPDGWIVNHESQELILTPALTDLDDENTAREKRTSLMEITLKLMSQCKARPEFTSLARKWRNETFPIHATSPPAAGTQRPILLLEIERSASALFGILTTGVQLTCYTQHPAATGEIKLWIARRSRQKQTYPGMLDNAAAGGLETGMSALEGVVRETVEEASLDERVVRMGVRSTGALSYFHVKSSPLSGRGDEGEVGFLQPEVEYIFELQLGEGIRPRPGDSEVEEFYLWNVEEVKEALLRGEFKLNSAIVVIDFFIRHGVITPENEGDYTEIVCRLHRRLG
ncbi:NUDIX hydrolase domain-like protein [Aspergillus pseudoustus]|uniref:NUDIX hydrolase domain-like protein n=1 Tax=Aspergillus pseudoustus TaxID=1810923 RepID=A0ABR4KGZ8_9EURO